MADFQDAFDSIKAGIKDISQLNVRTFTGDISVDANNIANLKLTDLLGGSGSASASVKVVGITNVMLDGDVDQFITSASVPAVTVTAHNAAVEAGQKSRQAVFQFFADKIKTAINAVS